MSWCEAHGVDYVFGFSAVQISLVVLLDGLKTLAFFC
jgi:hypothetical protein